MPGRAAMSHWTKRPTLASRQARRSCDWPRVPLEGQRILHLEPQLPPRRGPGRSQTKASRTWHHPPRCRPAPLKTAKGLTAISLLCPEAFCESFRSTLCLRGHVGVSGPQAETETTPSGVMSLVRTRGNRGSPSTWQRTGSL